MTKLFWLTMGLVILYAQSTVGDDFCNMYKTCGECISADVRCNWCLDLNATDHCFSMNTTDFQCLEVEEIPANITFEEDRPSEQIKPQRVVLQLRKGESKKFNFSISPISGYPLDIYFLFDYSNSLRSVIQSVKKDIQVLVETLKNISNDAQVGLGAYIDKPMKPFITTHPDNEESPCSPKTEGCGSTFAFRNLLNLTDKIEELALAFNRTHFSVNLDPSEGLLDGLMQAAVCKEVIGWRETAQHLIFAVTDQDYKIAGHGKVAGIVKRNDGQCHLVDNDYTTANEYDYPSLNHLAKVFQEVQIVPLIFLTNRDINSDTRLLYQKAIDGIEGALFADSDNLIMTVQRAYEQLTARISPTTQSPANINVTLDLVSCPSDFGSEPVCSNIGFNQTAVFEATVTPTDCENGEITIGAVFFGSIKVIVEVICDCQCEKEENRNTEPSDFCNSNGTIVCGMCDCFEGRCGDECEFEVIPGQNEETCPMGENGLLCSGFGDCNCAGKCMCFDGYYKDDCSCTDSLCDSNPKTTELCSGFPCKCGVCQCGPGFNGSDCRCSRSKCMPKRDVIGGGDNMICSGQGTCKCDKCECNEGFYGPACENCEAGFCTIACPEVQACATCHLTFQGDSVAAVGNPEDCNEFCPYPTTVEIRNVPQGTTNYGLSMGGITLQPSAQCQLNKQGDTCSGIQYFVFFSNDNGNRSITIHASSNPSTCPVTVEAWIIIVPILVGLLILGIIILAVIKMILVLLDYLEYKKFENDVKDNSAGNMINPLYTAPQHEIENPLYAGAHTDT